MKISSISKHHNQSRIKNNISLKSPNNTPERFLKSNNISFGSGVSGSINNHGSLYLKQLIHYTKFFRNDLNWNELVDILTKHFAKQKKVKTLCYACSDGSEAYSLAMLLSKQNEAKFNPIVGFDLKSNAMDIAKSYFVGIDGIDISNMNKYGIDSREFLEIPPNDKLNNSGIKRLIRNSAVIFRANKKLQSLIDFKEGNIAEDLKTMTPQKNPILLFFRNAAYHLKNHEIKLLSKNLAKKLPKDSLVISGRCDETFNSLLLENGFKILKQFGDGKDNAAAIMQKT